MTRGTRLCSAVAFETSGPTTEIGMCHCSVCGSPAPQLRDGFGSPKLN
jgi:hypothetical protein